MVPTNDHGKCDIDVVADESYHEQHVSQYPANVRLVDETSPTRLYDEVNRSSFFAEIRLLKRFCAQDPHADVSNDLKTLTV